MLSGLVAALGAIFLACAEEAWQRAVGVTAIALSLVGAGWAGAAGLQAPVVLRELVVTPCRVDNENGSYTQIVFYNDVYGERVFVNVADVFGGSIPDGSKVVVTEYKKYYYLGVSFQGVNVMPPAYRVVR